MEYPKYKNVNDFQINYLIDFYEFGNGKSEIRYLQELQNDCYISLINKCFNHYYEIEEKYFESDEDYHRLFIRLSKNNYIFNIIQESGAGKFAGMHAYTMSYLNNNVLKDRREIISIINVLYDEIINSIRDKYKSITIENEQDFMVVKCTIEQKNKPLIEIIDEIQNKINSILRHSNNNLITEENPEYDFSDTVPLERMIILEKLGIIKYIQSLQKDSKNEKQTAIILSSFTGINSDTIAKNLGVMLGVKKNDMDKNSPYKNPKNQQFANNKLSKFNIDLTKSFK